MDLSTSKVFNAFISLVIVANTIVLGLDKYPNDTKKTMLTDFLNFIFYVIFLLEMFIKQTATGFKMYFKDNYNTFDCIVVAVSTLDLCTQ